MNELILFIQSHVEYAHWIIFFALCLAGLNIPVSEDAMLFISGVLAAKYPQYFYHLFMAVFLGAYLSDLICYFLGKHLGPKLWKIKFFSNMVPKEKTVLISNFYEKYGILTLLFGRFIPFGVRNALFLTAGLGQMNFLKFSLSDLAACTISCVTYFSLYYNFGEKVIDVVKKGNIYLGLTIFIVAIIYFLFVRKKKVRGAN